MTSYLIRRFIILIPVLLGMLTFVFILMRVVPGDPVRLMVGFEVEQEEVERIRHNMGLDRPILIQYKDYLFRVMQADLGTSLRSNRPVIQEVSRHYKNSLVLAVISICFATAFGIVLGGVAAYYHRRAPDSLTMILAVLGVSAPSYYSGILFILLFAVTLNWLPAGGAGSLKNLILPAITLAGSSAAITARMTRSSLLDVLHRDYMRTAIAKGRSRRGAVIHHGLRNALITTATVVGLEFGYMLGGTVLVETVFSYPGVGSMMIKAIAARDFPVVQGGVLAIAFTFVFVNLLIDICYAVLDPRIRY